MAVKEDTSGVSETENGDFGVRGRNSETAARSQRLRSAVREAGGNKLVAARAGIPIATLNNYLSGRDMKAQALLALADATRVRMEWLLAGRGPKHSDWFTSAPGEQPAVGTVTQEGTVAAGPSMPFVPETRPAREHALAFTPANVDRLTEAIRRAQRLYAEENRLPSPRRFAQILLLLYDELGTAEKSSADPET